MTRKHFAAPGRPVHHERSNEAVQAARTARKLFMRIRLWLNDRKAREADEHFADLAASHEMVLVWMVQAQRRRVEIAAERMAIERGLA